MHAQAVSQKGHDGLVELAAKTNDGLVAGKILFSDAEEVMTEVEFVLPEHAFFLGADVGASAGNTTAAKTGGTGEHRPGAVHAVRAEDLLDGASAVESPGEHVIGIVEAGHGVDGPLPLNFAGVAKLSGDLRDGLLIDCGIISHGCDEVNARFGHVL